MKSAVLTGIRKFELQDIPVPDLKSDTDVLIKVGAVGVCGSDLHYYLSDRVGDQAVQYPWTLGHECAGVVEETGKKVMKVKPGDLAAIDPALPCGGCDQCLEQRPHTCRNLFFLGYPGQSQGCLAEFLVVPEGNCHPIPAGMTVTEAALAEPLSIGVYAVGFLDDLERKSIGILGSGPIGLSVLFAAKHRKARSIYATDKIGHRLKVAKKSGAAWTGNPDNTDVVKMILADEPQGLDAVFECCGDQAALDQAVELLRPGGMLLVVGIPLSGAVSFNMNLLRRKELVIQNVRRQNQCFKKAARLIGQRKIDISFMATHSFKLSEAQKAFELASAYEDGVIKAIVALS